MKFLNYDNIKESPFHFKLLIVFVLFILGLNYFLFNLDNNKLLKPEGNISDYKTLFYLNDAEFDIKYKELEYDNFIKYTKSKNAHLKNEYNKAFLNYENNPSLFNKAELLKLENLNLKLENSIFNPYSKLIFESNNKLLRLSNDTVKTSKYYLNDSINVRYELYYNDILEEINNKRGKPYIWVFIFLNLWLMGMLYYLYRFAIYYLKYQKIIKLLIKKS